MASRVLASRGPIAAAIGGFVGRSEESASNEHPGGKSDVRFDLMVLANSYLTPA
jgi:hypothetical protein